MGSFDCYCALCSGPLGLYNIKLGSRNPIIIAARRRYIAVRQRREKGEDVHEDSFMDVDEKGMSRVWVDGSWEEVVAKEWKVREWEVGTNGDLGIKRGDGKWMGRKEGEGERAEGEEGERAEGEEEREVDLPLISGGTIQEEQDQETANGHDGGSAGGDEEMVDGTGDNDNEGNNHGNEGGGGDNGPENFQEDNAEVIDMDGDAADDEANQEDEDAVEDVMQESDGADGNGVEHAEDDDDDDDSEDEDEEEDEDEDDVDDSRWSDVSDISDAEVASNGDSEEAMNRASFDWDEQNRYDPGWLSLEDIKWVDRARCLALNREMKLGKNAYISGIGRYGDLFDFHISFKGTSDPRDDHYNPLQVYHSYEVDEADPAFPMHEACAKILFRRLGLKDQSGLNRDLMYEVMAQNMGDLARNLELDYGGIKAEQFWESRPGEEWTVADPSPVAGIADIVQSMIPASLFGKPVSGQFDLSHKVKQDGFEQLPYDILHNIVAHLDRKSTVNLLEASWYVFQSTHNSTFWKLMIRKHMSFFYELDVFLKSIQVPDNFDWRGMFQWLDKITKGEYGKHGPLMKIANRRRIWNTCGQVSQFYFDKLLKGTYSEPSDLEAAAIMASAQSYHTPITSYPPRPASETRTETTQFIRSWSEVEYRACDLETYWSDHYGKLLGISVRFGATERLFGSNKGLKKQGFHMEKGEWINQITLHVDEVGSQSSDTMRNLKVESDDARTLRSSDIKGMGMELTSGKQKQLKLGSSPYQRVMPTLEGMYLVGVTGTIALDGSITTFGLLQAPKPCTESVPVHLYPSRDRLLWHTRSMHNIPYRAGNKVHVFPTSPIPPISKAPIPDPEMIPWYVYQFNQGTANMNKPLAILHFKNSVIGVKQGRPKEDKYPPHIGHTGPVPASISDFNTCKTWDELDPWKRGQEWDENDMKYFHMDRKGGEEITQLKATKDRRAFTLVTNRERSGGFGRDVKEGEEWDVLEIEKDEVVTSLIMTFGEPVEWSEGMRMWSHFVMTNLGVITTERGRYEKGMAEALKY